jgi:Ca-activated chloride channel family protein
MRVRALVLLALAACTGESGKSHDPATTLNIIAGSELKDIEPYTDLIHSKTGVWLAFTYSGTLAGIDRLDAGEAFDAAWFSHAKYLALSAPKLVKAQEKIMLSPVVLGVKRTIAQSFGWANNPNVTWADIATKVKAGQFHYAMTNPAASNSGFSAMIGVASALSHSANALTVSDINTKALHDFFQGQALTAGSSGWLAETYVRDQDRLDGMINYESVLLSLNRGTQLREPLVLIYPKEGIVTADYPLVLLSDAKRPLYTKVVAFLRSKEMQDTIMQATFRRPVNPDVTLSSAFPTNLIVDLAFPSDREVIDRLLFSYLNDQRLPAHSFFLLDVSGSMRGPRLDQVQTAINTLCGADSTLTGRFARFQNREQVSFVTFSTDVHGRDDFALPDSGSIAPAVQAIEQYGAGLQAGGQTALFTSLKAIYDMADSARRADSKRYYSIVVMTDGESNRGMSWQDFRDYYSGLPPDQRGIRVFPIVFGEADQSQLQAIADLTGGRLFNGNTGALASVFKEIRGYQ